MKNRKQSLYFEDILECISNIESYMIEISKQDFEENHLVRDAVMRNLEVIGGDC